ncbi:MAG: hypothetical protein QOJ80_7336 [Mycobacterium sp.]|jgi:hypothetical protein|nr:hypothetical protein [Mycobacterium sp.]
MTSQTSSHPGWRRAATGGVASAVLAAGLIAGFGSGTASADVLDDINAQYDVGSGGGQLSNLVHSAIKLRAAGYVPSKGNMADLEAGMAKRPNQGPLVEALEATVAFQRRNQARGAAQQPQGPSSISINQAPNGLPPGIGPGGGVVLPVG